MANLNIRIPDAELLAYRQSLRPGETLSERLRQDMRRSIAERARKRKLAPVTPAAGEIAP